MDEMKLYVVNGIIGTRFYDASIVDRKLALFKYKEEVIADYVHNDLLPLPPRDTFVANIYVLTGTLQEVSL